MCKPAERFGHLYFNMLSCRAMLCKRLSVHMAGCSAPALRHKQQVPGLQDADAAPHAAKLWPLLGVHGVQVHHGVPIIRVMHRIWVYTSKCLPNGSDQHQMSSSA